MKSNRSITTLACAAACVALFQPVHADFTADARKVFADHAGSVFGLRGLLEVTVTMNGQSKVQGITIDPEVVDKDDVEMLQDLVLSALTECGRKVDEEVQAKVSGLTAGLKIPGFG